MSRREETLRLEVDRLRNSFSFQFGNLFVQAIERPITLPLLPFKVLAFLFKSTKQEKKLEAGVNKITRNCIVGYSADSPRSIHFDRMEVILRELRSQDIQTVHVTNDRSACLLDNSNSHSIYTIPSRSHFDDMIPRTWNKKLENIFSGILDTFHPRTMIFDGDYPFRGVLNAVALRPEMNRFWVRESLLNFKISSLPIDAFDEFDAIIHPSLNRRDDPDTIIGQSGTIFCNPIMGSPQTREFLDAQKLKMNLENETVVFVQLNTSIRNIEEIFETLILNKSVQILTMHTKVPKRFAQHANVTTYHHLSTEEAVQIADICFISPDFFNIYSCLGNKKPTMCIVESSQHLDSIFREFGTKKLPIILIEGEYDSKFISDGMARLQNLDFQKQLTQRMDELNLQDGTPELCKYITELHKLNQIKVDSTD
jgi:hypothetical protein